MKRTEEKQLSYAVWPTAWGPIGGVAGPEGLCRLVLPHYGPHELAQLLAWEHRPASPSTAPFEELIRLTRDYFDGKCVDFGGIACSLPPAGSFTGKVLRACRAIPYGQTRSYGQLAEQIGRPDAAQAVAAALGRNPIPLVVPCHRVIYADGRLGGFSAAGGPALKERMLRLEGALR